MYAQWGVGISKQPTSQAWVVNTPVALQVSTTRCPHFVVFGTHETALHPSVAPHP